MVQSGEQDAQNSPSCFSVLTPTIFWEAASSRKPSLIPLHVLRKSSAPAPRASSSWREAASRLLPLLARGRRCWAGEALPTLLGSREALVFSLKGL